MRLSRPGRIGLVATAVGALFVLPATVASAAPPPPVSVLHVGQIARQDVPALPGSEPDTLVEPDVAASPQHPNFAVAVSHDGRYPDGGAVAIEYAWTHDAGATWHHAPLPGVTSTTGGPAVWARASDPVLAWAPDGSVYASTLIFNNGCDTAVAVSRSTNGGQTFSRPVLAHRSADCAVSDDKNWLVVDNGATSPHRGRLYQFWTPFLTDIFGNADGSPQALVYSDDHGQTWSAPVNVSPPHANTQNSQPMILPGGTVVDAYIDYGASAADEGSEAAEARHGRGDTRAAQPAARGQTASAAAADLPVFTTRISGDGGNTWVPGGNITRDLGDGPPGFRCCLPSTTVDPATARMYATWNSIDATKVRLSSSTDGSHWSRPVTVNRPTTAQLGVSADVAAYRGTVSVSYGLTNANTTAGRFGQQYVAVSRNGGQTFPTTIAVGPRIDYAYAAVAGGIFPGDYIGSSISGNRLYAAWCVSTRPPTAGATYHQVLDSATFGI